MFDLLELAFDPPDTNQGRIVRQFELKKKELESLFSQYSQNTVLKNEYQMKLDLLEEYRQQIMRPVPGSDQVKPDMDLLRQLAEKKTKARIQELAAAAVVIRNTKSSQVTEKLVRFYAAKTGLSRKRVGEVFAQNGITVVAAASQDAYPKFPTNSDLVTRSLAMIRQKKNPDPNGVDTAVITDLYGLAAFLSNDSNPALYRAMRTEDLLALFDAAGKKYSMLVSTKACDYDLYKSVIGSARQYVFKTQTMREQYDRYLLYQNPKLQEIFASLKSMPRSFLISSEFADPCIKTICEFFPDHAEALAIYNKEAGLESDPYEPDVWTFTVKCSFCGAVSEFQTEAAAQQRNQCTNCKKPLFKACGHCGKPVQVQFDACPYCKFVFSGAALFARFIRQAEEALRRSDFDEARRMLSSAQSADPNEKTRTAQLSAEIEQQAQRYQEPLNRLKSLIAQKKFTAAQKLVSTILVQYPGLHISGEEQTVRAALQKADAAFDAAAQLPAPKKADVCVAVLMECADHSRAAAFLQSTPPQPCSSLTLKPDTAGGEMQLGWSRSAEKGVRYQLVRKPGKTPPISVSDGTVLLDDPQTCSYADKSVQPGQFYSYAVFVVRMGVCSQPAGKTGVLLTDVQHLTADQNGSSIRLTWDAADAGRAALVYRSCGSEQTLLTKEAYGCYEDKNVQLRQTYTYRVCVIYGAGQISPGAEITMTPMQKIGAFSVSGKRISQTVCEVSWDIAEPQVNLRVLVNGQPAANASSEQKSVQVTLPGEMLCVITVQAYSGGAWSSAANQLRFNTYSPCRISQQQSSVTEHPAAAADGAACRAELHIVMQTPLPPNVTAFHYAVRTADAAEKWVTSADYERASDLQKISIGSYQQEGAIVLHETVQRETSFCVSVFTVYRIGSDEVISESDCITLERPMEANLFWSIRRGLLGTKLSVRMNGNRQISYVPRLLLCACSADQHLTDASNPVAKLLADIAPVTPETPVPEYRASYPVRTDIPGGQLKKMKFFLFLQDVHGTDTVAVRWDPPFDGTI